MVLSEMGLTNAKTQRDVFATRSCVIQFGVKVVNYRATFDPKSQKSLTTFCQDVEAKMYLIMTQIQEEYCRNEAKVGSELVITSCVRDH